MLLNPLSTQLILSSSYNSSTMADESTTVAIATGESRHECSQICRMIQWLTGVLVQGNGHTVDIFPQLVLARIDPQHHPTGNCGPKPVHLSEQGRLGVGDLNITHLQEAEAFFVQVSLKSRGKTWGQQANDGRRCTVLMQCHLSPAAP